MSKAKFVIFIAGLAIIGAMFALFQLPVPEQGFGANVIFFWISLVVLYALFFVPLLFSSLGKGSEFDKKIPSSITLWISILIIEVVSIPLSIVVLLNVFPMKIALCIDLILIFICSIFVYFGSVAGAHIQNVQTAERAGRAKIETIRSEMQLLLIKNDSLDIQFDSIQKRIRSIGDDVRYLSPVGNDRSDALESKLITLISEVSAALDAVVSGADSARLEEKVQQLQTVVTQRKTLYL